MKTKKAIKTNSTNKVRKWFFTIWKMDICWGTLWDDYNDIIRFICVQKEKTPTTGRLHWQGVIHMKDACRLSKMRRLLNLGKGDKAGNLMFQQDPDVDSKKAIAYCSKEYTSQNEHYIFGTPSRQGIRSDLRQIKKYLMTIHLYPLQ